MRLSGRFYPRLLVGNHYYHCNSHVNEIDFVVSPSSLPSLPCKKALISFYEDICRRVGTPAFGDF